MYEGRLINRFDSTRQEVVWERMTQIEKELMQDVEYKSATARMERVMTALREELDDERYDEVLELVECCEELAGMQKEELLLRGLED